LNEWRGADVTMRSLRELRELKPTSGPLASNPNEKSPSKRRNTKDWARAVFADDVGNGTPYEAFVAAAMRHAGDARFGPGSGPAERNMKRHTAERKPNKQQRSEDNTSEKKSDKQRVKYKHRVGGSASNPAKKEGRNRNKSKRSARSVPFADDAFFEDCNPHGASGDTTHKGTFSKRNRYAYSDSEADGAAFWEAFAKAARKQSGFGFGFGFDGFGDGYQYTEFQEKAHRPGSNPGSNSTRHTNSCPHRATLGIASGLVLTEKALKGALRESAMRWHPDVHSGDDKAAAEFEFKKAYDAYDALKNELGR
jgi:ubiquitin